ncbi:MAG: hypothetical protein AB2L14_12215 [Candidatus Xenobiia bacterium LiM19]
MGDARGSESRREKEIRPGLWNEGKRPRRGTEGNGQYEVTGKTYFGGLTDVDDFRDTAALPQ